MVAKNSDNDETQNDDQLEFDFPNPDDFENFDEADSQEVEAGLPKDSFELNTADFNTEGCGCVR